MNIKDKIYHWIAWQLPRGLVSWCAIRVMAYASAGIYGGDIVSDIRGMEAIKRWDKGNNLTTEHHNCKCAIPAR